MKVAFVVLHYENLDDTKECLESLKKYLNDDTHIIAVDNGSTKEKLKCLEAEFINKNIKFIYSKENLGFARGNNLGFLYAKDQLNAEIIVLANNDLVFEQQNFVERLIKHCKEDLFDIAGPAIISLKDGKNQNPVKVQYNNVNAINKRIFKYLILYMLSIINLDVLAQKRWAKEIVEFYPKEDEDFQLHGACMFFSSDYIKKYDGLYEKTFMYNEEGILKEISDKNSFTMEYYEDLTVKHKEGASTQATYGKGRKKRQFYYKWNIHSCRLLKKIKVGKEAI